MTKPVKKTIEMTRSQWNSWDRNLRSGKIKQTRAGCLIDEDGAMCCLGVLEHAIEGVVESHLGFPSPEFLKRNNIKFLDENGDQYEDDDEEKSPYLTGGYAHQLNDDKGLSFKQIAQRLKSRIKFIKAEKR